jgi:hypothetical protein
MSTRVENTGTSGSGERWTSPSLTYLGGIGDLMRIAGSPGGNGEGEFGLFQEEEEE